MQEFALIDRLRSRLRARRADTTLGIGDDAALLAPPAGHEIAVTTDTLISGRHFPPDTSAFDIGYKAVAVNLSDLAAMGAVPAWLTIALAAPDLEPAWCEAFIDGAEAAIGSAEVDIVGGDTTRGALAITITALGLVRSGQAMRRDRAQPGDLVAVTGTLGDAACGLSLWSERENDRSADALYLRERLCRPQWRATDALCGQVSAAIDISDGLAADLGHVLKASDVGATLDPSRLPTSPALARQVPEAGARHRLQLAGGDDYELCLIIAPRLLAEVRTALDCQLTVIGRIEARPGLRYENSDGQPLEPLAGAAPGWDHFG
ncbi:thiamine-phosphate kinase [Salinisphaera sp. T31B1]|uniref:thiamine-phosphate kinase n=1 Tax=Salinisphaera sp. T31B1 TaxID=727963 RepID=UPI003340797A